MHKLSPVTINYRSSPYRGDVTTTAGLCVCVRVSFACSYHLDRSTQVSQPGWVVGPMKGKTFRSMLHEHRGSTPFTCLVTRFPFHPPVEGRPLAWCYDSRFLDHWHWNEAAIQAYTPPLDVAVQEQVLWNAFQLKMPSDIHDRFDRGLYQHRSNFIWMGINVLQRMQRETYAICIAQRAWLQKRAWFMKMAVPKGAYVR